MWFEERNVAYCIAQFAESRYNKAQHVENSLIAHYGPGAKPGAQ